MTIPTTRLKVVITHWVHDDVLQFLGQHCSIVPNTTRETLPREDVLARCSDADGVIVFMPDLVDEDFLDHCPRLKVIAAALKGFDNIDVVACQQRGIAFSYAPDLLTVPTAELAVALLLTLGRSVLPGDRLVRSGSFQGWQPILYGKGLFGSTVGILGMGAIGRAIAVRLSGFECQLQYHDPVVSSLKESFGLDLLHVPLPDLLALSDFLILAAPLTADTFHILDEHAIARMKPGAYLINICRGSVVDEEALARGIESGQLAGYASDVFEFEDWSRQNRPQYVNPDLLLQHDRTVFTPHLGSAVDAIRRDIAMEAARAVVANLFSS